ncbi:MAG: hypothetical protein AABX13_04520 [Nanoarchaeota archaeon]
MGIEPAQLEQLVKKKIVLHDSRTDKSLTGVVLYAPPKEQRGNLVLVYREKSEFFYKLLPPHWISSLEITPEGAQLKGEINGQVSWYDSVYKTLVN